MLTLVTSVTSAPLKCVSFVRLPLFRAALEVVLALLGQRSAAEPQPLTAK